MVTELSKTVAEQAKSSQKAINDLKSQTGAALNVVQAQEKYQHPRGGKQSKGGGKGKGTPTSSQYPANIMCEYVDQGKECPKYGTPEGCEYMHPEDGFEKNRAKRDAHEEAMKQKQDGKYPSTKARMEL